MSMMCYVAALSPGQIAAFCEHPELASDFAKASAGGLVDQRVQAALARLPLDARERYQQAQRDRMTQDPLLRQQMAERDAGRETLATLGPFEPLLELGKGWHVLHYLITGHADPATSPGDTLLSGTPLGTDVGYGPPRLHIDSETRAFRNVLAQLEADHLAARLDFPLFVRLRIYPLDEFPDAANAEDWRVEVAGSFDRLKAYVGRATERGDGLLTWLS
jgi:hypothetical protein